MQLEPLIGVYNEWAPLSYPLSDGAIGGSFVEVAQV